MKEQPLPSLRIAMLGQKHSFSREGGVEVVAGALALRMAMLGHSVTLFDRSPRPQGLPFPRLAGLRLRQVPTLNRGGLAAFTSSLAAAVRAAFGPYDVVHFHAEGPAAVCWIPKLAGKRVICTIHGLDWQREKWGCLASAYIRLGEKTAVRFADEIIVLNENTRDYFRERYGRETCVVPNGTSKAEKLPARMIRQTWDLAPDGFVLFVGRLVPEKGLRLLLNAWRGIETEKTLVIAGGGACSFLRELEAIAGNNVLFTGPVQGQILEELYSNAYLFVLPSDLEGMPLSLLEAMSYANCCRGSDIPSCRETAEDGALYFAQGDEESLRAALQELLDHPDAVMRWRETAASVISKKHSWDEIAA